MSDVFIRRRRADDDARLVAIYQAHEADGPPRSLGHYRGTGDQTELWVAEIHGEVVGYAGFVPAWWTGDPHSYQVELMVNPRREGQGIARWLAAAVQDRLDKLGARQLFAMVRADAVPGRDFAAGHGFAEAGAVIDDYRLRISQADPAAYADIAADLHRSGITIASLAEAGIDDARLRAVYELWSSVQDGDRRSPSFDFFRDHIVDGPGQSRETFWVALESGQPVGLTYLKRLTLEAAENDFTLVAPSHRGRGIAPVLKLAAIDWARQHGVDWFYTSSEAGNEAMIAVNRRLGYIQGPRRIELVRRLD